MPRRSRRFGARTFFETFAADNTAEDMRLYPGIDLASGPAARRNPGPGARHAAGVRRDGALAGIRAAARGATRRRVSPCAQPVELKRFYVDKPWHGQGLARTLMEAVEHAARARGARELWLGVWERNERAQAFYRKCGFRKVGTQIFVVGTDPQTDHVMLRELE